jgi:hypothetical protein
MVPVPVVLMPEPAAVQTEHLVRCSTATKGHVTTTTKTSDSNISNHVVCHIFFVYFLGGQECVGHSFAYVAHFVFLRYVWIRTQRTAVGAFVRHR